jgi:tetratricopeptide (TPR) repeat protein
VIIDFASIAQSGLEALHRGDPQAARTAFDQVEAAGRGTHQLRLLLAQACRLLDDSNAAHRALDKVLAEEPTNLYALIMRGDLHAAASNPRAAVSWYQAALMQAPRAGQLPPDLVQALKHAELALKDSSSEFQLHLERHFEAVGVNPDTAGSRFAEALEILGGRAEVQLQQPTSFYFPGLSQRAFFERVEFAWVSGLEAVAPAIRAELESVLADDAALTPYVAPDENRPAKRHALLNDPNWSAFHLFRNGAPVSANAARCPATMAALEQLPLPYIADRSPMALFSVLRSGTHIPPHNGMLNTRLICHLPLIVPAKCRLRVGNQTRAVETDRVMIFDDSIEHEAWNSGNSTRVVLLFEVWRPDLTDAERGALTALYEAIGAYAPVEEDQAGA